MGPPIMAGGKAMAMVQHTDKQGGENAMRVQAIIEAVGRERRDAKPVRNFPKPVGAVCKRAQDAITRARKLDAEVRRAQCALSTLRARCEHAHRQAIGAIDCAKDALESAK